MARMPARRCFVRSVKAAETDPPVPRRVIVIAAALGTARRDMRRSLRVAFDD